MLKAINLMPTLKCILLYDAYYYIFKNKAVSIIENKLIETLHLELWLMNCNVS